MVDVSRVLFLKPLIVASRLAQRLGTRALGVTVVGAMFAMASQATPMTSGGSAPVNLHWRAGSTINVYVDPVDGNRDDLVADGVRRWIDRLAGRGITVTVTVGAPPAGATNVVRYTFVPPGTTAQGGLVGGPDGDDGRAGCTSNNQTGEIVGGGAAIRNDLPTGTAEEQEFARNLGEHEFIHVLGLADDPGGAVTNHEQAGAARPMNAIDAAELNQVYAAAGAALAPRALAEFVGGGAGQGFFDYRFTFQPGHLASAAAGEEHISWLGLDIDPRLVTGLVLPPGWIGLVPRGAVSASDPFFTRDDYQIDSTSSLSPWDALNPISYIAMRSSDDEARADGLATGDDPAMNLGESVVIRVLTGTGVGDGRMGVLAGAGPLQTLVGPVPEPGTAALVAAAALALLWRSRGYKRRDRR